MWWLNDWRHSLNHYPLRSTGALSKQTFPNQVKHNQKAAALGRQSFIQSSFIQQMLWSTRYVPGPSLGTGGTFSRVERPRVSPQHLPCPGRSASNFAPHPLFPPTANTVGPATWGRRLWSHTNHYKPCFPSVLGLQDPLGIMTQCRGEHGGACSRSQREGLQIGGILLFSPFHSENFPKREIYLSGLQNSS